MVPASAKECRPDLHFCWHFMRGARTERRAKLPGTKGKLFPYCKIRLSERDEIAIVFSQEAARQTPAGLAAQL